DLRLRDVAVREGPRVGVEERLVAALVEEPAVSAHDEDEGDERQPLEDDDRDEHRPRLVAGDPALEREQRLEECRTGGGPGAPGPHTRRRGTTRGCARRLRGEGRALGSRRAARTAR